MQNPLTLIPPSVLTKVCRKKAEFNVHGYINYLATHFVNFSKQSNSGYSPMVLNPPPSFHISQGCTVLAIQYNVNRWSTRWEVCLLHCSVCQCSTKCYNFIKYKLAKYKSILLLFVTQNQYINIILLLYS